MEVGHDGDGRARRLGRVLRKDGGEGMGWENRRVGRSGGLRVEDR